MFCAYSHRYGNMYDHVFNQYLDANTYVQNKMHTYILCIYMYSYAGTNYSQTAPCIVGNIFIGITHCALFQKYCVVVILTLRHVLHARAMYSNHISTLIFRCVCKMHVNMCVLNYTVYSKTYIQSVVSWCNIFVAIICVLR